MHNYEMDSLCYPLWLSYHWCEVLLYATVCACMCCAAVCVCFFTLLTHTCHRWKASGRAEIFDDEWAFVVDMILQLWITEQRHEGKQMCAEGPMG